MESDLFLKHSIAELLAKYKSKELTPIDVAEGSLDTMRRLNEKYKAMVCYDDINLLRQARLLKLRLEGGKSPRPLEGMPLGVKDIFNTIDFPTQMGSPLWKEFTPGNDARSVFYVKEAGGLISGKTGTAEFAVHTLGETLNPHNVSKSPGTSSSGSAVGIALGMFPVSLGTQTAGSIVRPASFCGIYGCKPSFGLIPRTGTLKTTDSLDTIGFFTAFCADLERMFEVVRVKGPDYPISHAALTDEKRQTRLAKRPWQVALAKTHTFKHAPSYAQGALLDFAQELDKNKEIEVHEVELPSVMKNAHDVHATIYNKTLSYYFKGEFERSELVSPIMNELITQGLKITSKQYQEALIEQEIMIHQLDSFLINYDTMVSLSTAGEAPPRHNRESPDPALMWTMTHLPVISVPAFISPNGLPFGMQIVSRKYNDYLLFKFIKYLRSKNIIPAATNPVLRLA